MDRPKVPLDSIVLRNVVEAAPDGVLVVGADGAIEYGNPALEAMFGAEPDGLAGRDVSELLPDGWRERPPAAGSGSDPAPVWPSGHAVTATGCDGVEFPVEIFLGPSAESGEPAVAIVRDVREHRGTGDELARARESLALIGERERIGRDLHDTVIQRLFSVGLSLQGALVRADDPVVRKRLEEAVAEIDDTIRDIRKAVFALNQREPSPAPGSETP